MSSRYSSVPQGNKRKSIFTPSVNAQPSQESSAQAIELERLEQEITLTLQSIDKNFAKSHKIINDKLIPVIKDYHANSKKIGSGVNFWKSFFETSANVELRGYEEAQNDNLTETRDQEEENIEDENITLNLNEQFSPVKTQHEFLQESTNHNIPTIPTNNPIMPSIPQQGFDTTDSIIPPIPQSANLSNTNNETDVNQTTPTLQRTRTFQQPDVRIYNLHNNLDKNLKIQISPRRQGLVKHGLVNQLTPKRTSKKRKSMIAQRFDSSPFEIETPKLTSEVQLSPIKITQDIHRDLDQETTQRFPNTPKYGANGQLLQTTSQTSRTANRYSNQGVNQPQTEERINQFDDSETTSPPRTMQINSTNINLRQTPAREAAKNIVQDILNNVGGNDSGLSIEEFQKQHDFNSTANSLFNEQNKPEFDEFLDKREPEGNNPDWSDD